MAKSKDLVRTELLAIYRLEFYKKQNNWKLLKPRNYLNKTYTIEVHSDDDGRQDTSSKLNEAFVDSGNEEQCHVDTESVPPDDCQFLSSVPVAKTTSLWEHCDQIDGNTSSFHHHSTHRGDYQQLEETGTSWQVIGDPTVPVMEEDKYLLSSQLNSRHRLWASVSKTLNADDSLPSLEDEAWTPEDLLEEADLSECAEFLLGASAAPHSSEIELPKITYDNAILSDVQSVPVRSVPPRPSSACALPWDAGCPAAAGTHRSTLWDRLPVRTLQTSASGVWSLNRSCDVIPTRDCDPLHADRVVSGSHLPRPALTPTPTPALTLTPAHAHAPLGRGRGRLRTLDV